MGTPPAASATGRCDERRRRLHPTDGQAAAGTKRFAAGLPVAARRTTYQTMTRRRPGVETHGRTSRIASVHGRLPIDTQDPTHRKESRLDDQPHKRQPLAMALPRRRNRHHAEHAELLPLAGGIARRPPAGRASCLSLTASPAACVGAASYGAGMDVLPPGITAEQLADLVAERLAARQADPGRVTLPPAYTELPPPPPPPNPRRTPPPAAFRRIRDARPGLRECPERETWAERTETYRANLPPPPSRHPEAADVARTAAQTARSLMSGPRGDGAPDGSQEPLSDAERQVRARLQVVLSRSGRTA